MLYIYDDILLMILYMLYYVVHSIEFKLQGRKTNKPSYYYIVIKWIHIFIRNQLPDLISIATTFDTTVYIINHILIIFDWGGWYDLFLLLK